MYINSIIYIYILYIGYIKLQHQTMMLSNKVKIHVSCISNNTNVGILYRTWFQPQNETKREEEKLILLAKVEEFVTKDRESVSLGSSILGVSSHQEEHNETCTNNCQQPLEVILVCLSIIHCISNTFSSHINIINEKESFKNLISVFL